MATIHGYIRRHIAIVCKKIKALTKGVVFGQLTADKLTIFFINWNGSMMPKLLYQMRITSQNRVIWSKERLDQIVNCMCLAIDQKEFLGRLQMQ